MMQKRGLRFGVFLLVVLSFFISITVVVAQPPISSLRFKVIDAVTHKPITAGLVTIYLDREKITTYIQNGTLEVSSSQKESVIIIDDLETAGDDYYLKTKLDETTPTTPLAFFPIGSLRGSVKDKLANVVSQAQLQFQCQERSIEYPTTTDAFGVFFTELPVGSCRISASFGKGVGYATVDVKQGDLKDIEITLDRTIIEYNSSPTPLQILALILVVCSVVLAMIFYKKNKSAKAKVDAFFNLSKQINRTKRCDDILPTLASKEQNIVKFLLDNNAAASQATLRHALKIPRTSLTRSLQTLEGKKIVHVEKQGKAVKVQLTHWFLGKE